MNDDNESREDLQEHLYQLISDIYFKGKPHRPLRLNDKVRLVNDLGFDSLEVIQLIVKIESAFDVSVDDHDLNAEHFGTVQKLKKWVWHLIKAKGAKE